MGNFYSSAVAQNCNPISDGAHDSQVMRNENGCNIMLSGQIADQVQDRRLHRDVKRRGDLVTQQQVWPGGKGAGDGEFCLRGGL